MYNFIWRTLPVATYILFSSSIYMSSGCPVPVHRLNLNSDNTNTYTHEGIEIIK